MSNDRLIIVSSEGCPGCEQLRTQLKDPAVKEVLKSTFGTDEFEERNVATDDLAVKIAGSLGRYDAPLLTVVRQVDGKNIVCSIDENLNEVACAELKEVPE